MGDSSGSGLPGMSMPGMSGMSSGGGGKPEMPDVSNIGGYDFTLAGMPVTRETETTYGGGKPGKAPTPKPPEVPDPFEIIAAQGRENRVNEVGPTGSTQYSKDPVTGVWTANRSFSPELQGIYNQQVQMMGGDPNAYNQNVADSMFARQRSMMDPVFTQQNRAAEQKLADQGLPMEGEAYGGEMDRIARSQNEALNNAAMQSVLSGTQTGMQQRTNEFNQMAALLGGQQVGPTAPIDVTGPYNAQQQAQWNAYTAAANNAASTNAQRTQGATAAASLAAAMMMSSENAKVNKQLIEHDKTLEAVDSLRVERWQYKDGDGAEHIGPYAEEFRKLFNVGDGTHIGVIDAIGVCLSAIKGLNNKIHAMEVANVRI